MLGTGLPLTGRRRPAGPPPTLAARVAASNPLVLLGPRVVGDPEVGQHVRLNRAGDTLVVLLTGDLAGDTLVQTVDVEESDDLATWVAPPAPVPVPDSTTRYGVAVGRYTAARQYLRVVVETFGSAPQAEVAYLVIQGDAALPGDLLAGAGFFNAMAPGVADGVAQRPPSSVDLTGTTGPAALVGLLGSLTAGTAVSFLLQQGPTWTNIPLTPAVSGLTAPLSAAAGVGIPSGPQVRARYALSGPAPAAELAALLVRPTGGGP